VASKAKKKSGDYPASEVELFQPVEAWLKGIGSIVVPEVEMISGEARADLVAVVHNRAGVFEGKMSLSADLIRQAYFWQQFASSVTLVLPKPKGGRNLEKRSKFLPVFEALGFGLIHVSLDKHGEPTIDRVLSPHIASGDRSEPLMKILAKHLPAKPEAGSSNSQKSTSVYQETIRNLIVCVTNNPGISLKYAVKEIKHHYTSDAKARSDLSAMLRKRGGISGITAKDNHGDLQLDSDIAENKQNTPAGQQDTAHRKDPEQHGTESPKEAHPRRAG